MYLLSGRELICDQVEQNAKLIDSVNQTSVRPRGVGVCLQVNTLVRAIISHTDIHRLYTITMQNSKKKHFYLALMIGVCTSPFLIF